MGALKLCLPKTGLLIFLGGGDENYIIVWRFGQAPLAAVK